MRSKKIVIFLLVFTLSLSNITTVFASEVSVPVTETSYEEIVDEESEAIADTVEDTMEDTVEESIEKTEDLIDNVPETVQALVIDTRLISPTYAFIKRFYESVLGRNPDPTGLENWVSQLENGTKTGTDIAAGFLFSSEFKNKNYGNEAFIDVLYAALLNRTADTQGRLNWLSELASGCSRRYVVSRFIASSEFKNLCNSYGIKSGSLTLTDARDVNINATRFVGRLYQNILNRNPDENGINDWTKKLASKSTTGAGIANAFLNSGEYKGKNTTDEQFVTSLYKALLNRSPDASGKSHWLNVLKTGVSRTYVLKAFCSTTEFKAMCSTCQISQGSITTTEARDQNKGITQFVLKAYENCLGRTPNASELNQWTKQLNNGSLAIDCFLFSVIFSTEGKTKYSTNTQFITVLYQTVLQRGVDSSGFNTYSTGLASNKSKTDVFYALIASSEFVSVCQKYGISFSYNGWRQMGNGWCYYKNGKAVSGWSRIDGNRYYFNPSNGSKRATGWNYIDGYKYYFNNQGILVQDIRSLIGRQSSYQIKVNRQMNCITVYTQDTNGSYIIPVVSFVASTGANNKTPLGTFKSNRLGTWWTLLGPSYGQYVTQISGNYLFHSVPYYTRGNKYSLKDHLYRRLGSNDSAGCVRLTVADAKWIYENIPNKTTIIIYDSSNPGPFDKPTASLPAYRNGYGWYDPTDPAL